MGGYSQAGYDDYSEGGLRQVANDESLKAQWLMGALAVKMDEALGARGAFMSETRRLNQDLNEQGGVNMQSLELMRDMGRERGLKEEQMTLSQEDLAMVENPVFLEWLREVNEKGNRNPEFATALRDLNDADARHLNKGGKETVQ